VTTVRPALDAALRHTIALRTEALFRRSGAYREGHFQFEDGRHGDAYLEPFQLLGDPALTGELCAFLAEHGRGRDREPLVDLVASPTTAGVILAFETARQLGVRDIFAEEVRTDDRTVQRAFRHGFRITAGENVLLVDDILATGESLRALLAASEAMGGEVVECEVLVDRSGYGRATLASPTTGRLYALRSLWQLDLPTYEPGPATCPRCADGTLLLTVGGTGPDTVGVGASAH
jgi:orotate phosphoribosyltransferase